MRNFLILAILFLSFSAMSQQSLRLFDPSTKWILKKNKVDKNNIIFNEYNSEDLGINAMVWTFMPNGIISYDYESDPDIFACAGVNFLDLDLTDCYYTYDPINQTITMQIKGGVNAIDDFIFKREYKVSVNDDEENYGYKLSLIKEYFYNNLHRFRN